MKIKVSLSSEKTRFILVGVCNTILDFTILNTLVWGFGVWSYTANMISVVVCICISYYLNHYYVFQKKEKLSIRSFISFFAVTGFSSIFLQSAIIWLSHSIFATPFSRSILAFTGLAENQAFQLNLAKCAAVGIGMIWNYLFYKHLVFRKQVVDSQNQFIG
jgi:putative flippase GtrA